jgi:hypothetical protein
MIEQSPMSQPTPPSTPNEFPNGNAKDDIVYQMANPANPLQQLCIMSMETYMKNGTLIQSLRSVGIAQDKRIKELLAQYDVSQRLLADAVERLENLRAVRRGEIREMVESQMNLPPDYFSKPE